MPPSPHKRSFRRRRNSFSLAMFSRKPKPPPPKISGPLHLARHQPDTSFVLYTSPSFQSLQPSQSFASLQPSPSFQTTTFDPHPGQRVTFPEDFDCDRVPHLASSPVKRNLQPSPSFPYLQSSTSVTSISSFDPHPGQRVVLAPSSPSFHSGARKFFYGSGAELPESEFSGSPLWPNTPSSSPQISTPTKGYQDSPTKYVPRAAGAAPPPRLGRSKSVTPEKEKHATKAPLPRPVRERSISPEKMMHFATVPPPRPVRSRSVTPEKKKYAGTPLPRPARSRSVSSEKKKHVAGAPPPRPPPAPPLGVLREMVPVQGGMLLAAAKENVVDKEDYSFGVKKLFVRAPAESSRVRGRIRHVGLQEGGQIFLQMGAGGGNMGDVQRIGGGSKLTATGFQYPRSKDLAGEAVPYSRSKIGGDANPPVNITITTPNTISSSIESSTWTPVLDPDMLRRAHLLGINVGSSPSVTSVSPPSVRSIRAAKLPERGIPPLYWREMQHNGIWVMILQYVRILSFSTALTQLIIAVDLQLRHL